MPKQLVDSFIKIIPMMRYITFLQVLLMQEILDLHLDLEMVCFSLPFLVVNHHSQQQY